MNAPKEWRFTDLLEILRLYAEKYCRIVNQLRFCSGVFESSKLMKTPEGKDQNNDLTEKLITNLIPSLEKIKVDCDSIGLEATRDEVGHTLFIWEKHHAIDVLAKQCGDIPQHMEREFKRRVCLILPQSSQALYEVPVKGWEEIASVFPNARDDIEEMSLCRAFGRDSAAVFHALLIVEQGLIDLGIFLKVTDPKQGWDATCKELEKVLKDGRTNASRHIKKHFAFLELINKDVQSMKLAWRNKVSHAANRLVVITSDFKPQVAEKIITACHGFMLLLATEGPRKGK